MKNYLLLAFLSIGVLFACSKVAEEVKPKPTVDFTYSPNSPVIGETVTFTANVKDAKTLLWTSNPAGINLTQNVINLTFPQASTYQITLTATGDGGTTTLTKTITVTAKKPTVDFTFSPTLPTVNQSVAFTSTVTEATSLAWSSSPAGLNSTAANVNVTFSGAGAYQITLKATGPGGSTEVTKTVTVSATPITADFAVSGTLQVSSPLKFTSQTTNATTIEWDFGDNTKGSGAEVSKAYTQAGTYTVTMTASNSIGSAPVPVKKQITIAPIPQDITFTDKWVSAAGSSISTSSYRNHHYNFELREENQINISFTSSVFIAMYIYDNLGFEVYRSNNFNKSVTFDNRLKVGKYRLVVIGEQNADANYTLTFKGKLAEKPMRIETQYQRVINSWTFSLRSEPMSARNRHYFIEVTQDTQLDLILTSSAYVRLYLINELGFEIVNSGNSYGKSLWSSSAVKKGKYRIVASTYSDGEKANFTLDAFGHIGSITEIKSTELSISGSWTNSSTLASSPNNPKYTIDVLEDSQFDLILESPVFVRWFILNSKGDAIYNTGNTYSKSIDGTYKLPKGTYTIVAATYSNSQQANFNLFVYGHYIANLKLKP